MQKTDIIIAFCIFQYVDPNTNTYHSYLGDSVFQYNKKTNFQEFVCKEPDPLYRGWHNTGKFLAINPMPSHPIQTGMKLYCVKQTVGFPYNSIEAHIEYDPFNIEENCVYFVAYNQRVPFTIPLYFHTLGTDNVFASFDKYPPSDSPDWTQSDVSPVYVICPSTFQGIHANDIPFKCVNEKCIPWAKNIPDIYDNIPDTETFRFDQCILLCSRLGLIDEGSPGNILTDIRKSKTGNYPQFTLQPDSDNKLVVGTLTLLGTLLVCLIWLYISTRKHKSY